MLLPGDSPDLCYKVFVTDAREVPDAIYGYIFGAAIGFPSSPTFADKLLCRIRFTPFLHGLLLRYCLGNCFTLLLNGWSVFLTILRICILLC